MKREDLIKKADNALEAIDLGILLDKIEDGILTQRLIHGSFVDACVKGDWHIAQERADAENEKYLKNLKNYTNTLKKESIYSLPISWIWDLLPEAGGDEIIAAIGNELRINNLFTNAKWVDDVVYTIKVKKDLEIDAMNILTNIGALLEEVGVEYEINTTEEDIIILNLYQR